MEQAVDARGLKKVFRTIKGSRYGFIGMVTQLFRRDYSSVVAVDGIDLSIPYGEIRGLIGPNGAGKSTTIKMLSGVLHPTDGSVKCLGITPWEDRTSFVRRIAAVFGQKTQLMWDLPPSDTFALNQRLYRIPKSEYDRNVEYFADSFGLGEVLGTPVRNLSLGERMKCELTAAMLHNPELVFLDEPTIGLDLIAKDTVRSFVKRVNRDRKVTFLLTTHDLDDVEDLCQRVTIINHGHIVHDSSMKDLKSSYATRKVAEVRLAQPVAAESLADWEVLEHTDQLCRVVIDSARSDPGSGTASAIAKLLTTLPAKDLEVTNPPIEAVIRRIYGGEGTDR